MLSHQLIFHSSHCCEQLRKWQHATPTLAPLIVERLAAITQKVNSHFNCIVALSIHYMLHVATNKQLINCHESRPWRRGTSRTAGGSNGGKRSIRRTGVYTQETTTTEGKRWDEGRRYTSSCHPCRCYMGSIVCFWKSVMIVHVVIAEQINLRRRTTTNKYLLLFPSSLNYACHLHIEFQIGRARLAAPGTALDTVNSA